MTWVRIKYPIISIVTWLYDIIIFLFARTLSPDFFFSFSFLVLQTTCIQDLSSFLFVSQYYFFYSIFTLHKKWKIFSLLTSKWSRLIRWLLLNESYTTQTPNVQWKREEEKKKKTSNEREKMWMNEEIKENTVLNSVVWSRHNDERRQVKTQKKKKKKHVYM